MGLGAAISKRIAFVFPGQGSQYVGMGRGLYEASAAARRIFQQADEILGFSLSSLCFDGPAEELDDTINAQPAILTVSLAYLEALRERWHALGESVAPVYVAGHSLGEFTALVAAGAIDFGDALRLVRERGRLMKESGDLRPGGMAAVIGLEREVLEAVCVEAAASGIVVLANDNCPGQSVISGDLGALERAMELARLRGARKAVRLGISIASHSPLMERAGQQFNDLVGRIHLRDPQVPVIANISGQVLTTADDIRREIAHHVVRPVQWTGSVREMLNDGVGTFLEIGPGNVLGGLIKRITSDVEIVSAKDYGLGA
ncbi:MAG TPA: ACP S-malonyltransferase [Thermomicrobiaceae bacterium]|nr:ACP S-malonyltransferase [Thermomicrobiaceae bacterium]